jgi:hypothetical protein
MLGVAMITDPFGRLATDSSTTDVRLVNQAIHDNIPNDLKSKLIGLAICAPNVIALAGESEFSLWSQLVILRRVVTIMRVIKDQASTMQILVIISFCPALISALYVPT